MELHFATGNMGKVEDAESILPDVEVRQLEVEMLELQDACLESVAKFKLEQALEQSQLFGSHVIADDSGLFIDALDGFPGILSSPFDEKLGKEQLLDLVDEGAEAEFRAAVALHDPQGQEVHVFNGSCRGNLVEPRGERGFGYDPMFL
ncbi:MAG: non-canonical purine NTP pyrophosphatase, partial [Candidatus Nanohaloarchaea archaeon]